MTDKKVDQFVHLHSHADTSILDGFSTVPELVAEVARIGQPALAITDHGNMHGIYELYKHAKAAGIKPIAGIEAYMTPSIVNRHHHAQSYLADGGRDDVSGRGSYTHITLLAENNVGLKNLYAMQLRSYTEGFYQKNRIDLELLEMYGKGIIATTGCPSGEVQTRLRLGQEKEALAYAAKLQDILGKDNVFMELMEHGMASELERGVRNQLLDIAKKLNMPLVATNDLHYARHQDSKGHEELLCVQTRGVMSNPPEYTGNGTRFAFEGDEYYVKSRAEMEKYFSGLPEALNNTLLIAERCDITIEPDDSLRPTIAPPAGMTEAQYLRQEAFAGLAKRLPQHVNNPEYIERLNTELGIIELKNYIGYFLVVSDFVRWGKFTANPPVPTGFGRGCLSADTNVLTPLGFKKIKDIEVGDTVFDELGNQVVVPQVFEYDCDEPLVEIKGYYGNEGNKMTSDHKVLVSKANLETSKTKLSSGIKYKKEVNEPIWIRADEVEVGDLVVMPKLKFANTLEGFKVEPESTVMENRKLTHSVRNIAKSVGVSRNAVQDFVNNGGIIRGEASAKIASYLNVNGITVENLIEQRTITTNIGKDFIEANADMGFILGLFISAGWIRQDNNTSIGFAQNKSEDEGVIPAILEKVFGLKSHAADAKDKDLRQYTIRHKGVRALFAELFKDYSFNAQTKYIPSELLNGSEEFRRGLLEGLWYGDGTHKGKSKYTTVSEGLSEGVYTLLLSLGLPASLGAAKRIERRPEYNKSGRETWTEYSVVTAHNFDTSKMTRGRGFDGSFNYYRVREINIVAPEGKVYDFTVPTTNSYVTDSYVVHNSAAGSLLGFCLDITDVDPIKYDLLFERFINPERDSPPDIDMDFNDTDRERVIEYVKDKYGRDKVAQIVTFGKIGAKAALKDSVRILEQPFSMGEELSKALPEPVAGHSISLAEVYDPSAERYGEAGEFRALVERIGAQQVVEVSRAFEGRTRSTGVHAAALVVSTKPVAETVPMMQRQADGAMITQWDYPTCEGLGLLKVDFLGLRNLGIIANAIKNVEKTKGIQLSVQEIIQGDMDDKKTFEMLARGESLGVFQLDGCLAGNTLVSGRKIKDLYANYLAGKGMTSTYSIDLSTGVRKRNGIVRFVESGIKMVYRLVSESGRMIEATADHKFMTDSGWKRLGDINILVDRVLVDQTVKTLMYRECLGCGIQINSEQRNRNKRCYKCSAEFHSNPSKQISREAIAAARTAFYANGGEPWNKGLDKDKSPILAEVSRKVRAKLNGRNVHKERMSESEYAEYIVDMSNRMSGKNNPMYGKTTRISKTGYREDLGHYVRSSWEADYARVLLFLEEPYKYEPDTFELTRSDGSTMTYTPDFYLVNEDKYVEIKGFMRDIDAEKIDLVRKQHGIKLDVIAQSEFAELELEYKDLVAWECPEIPNTTEWEQIVSITQIGEQMTYDITMEAPLNNFLANGFMVHNSGMRGLMKQLRPTDLNDISALLALYRPGPMGVNAHTDYALRKNGEQEVTPIHAELKEPLAEILNETYGIIAYQEQIMRIAQKVANYSLAQADNLRRAMGKKKKSILDAEYVPFSEGMKDNGYSPEAIKALWDILIPFADYGFNKSHSVGYGVLSYLTAYLKANYAAEFMAALLTSVSDDTEKTALYLEDCKNMGIKVLPPDVNNSQVDYAPLSDTRISFGFKAIRGVGEKVAEEIVEIREGRNFESIQDFVNRVPKTLANKRILEALTLGGAFDVLKVSRKSMMEAIPDITAAITKANRKPTKAQQAKLDAAATQATLFGDETPVEAHKPVVDFVVPDVGEYSKLEKLKLERHALGLYVSGHPLEGLDLTAANANKISDFLEEIIKPIEGWVPRDAKPLRISGIVTSLQKKRTKKGETFALGTIEDLTGTIPFVMFPKAFAEHGEFLQLDGVYQMQGFPRKRDIDGINFTVDAIRPLEFSDSGKLSLRVKLTEKQWASGRPALIERLERHQHDGDGSTNVIISIKNEEGEVWEEVLDMTVRANPALTQEIRELFGMLSIGRWRKV